MFSLSNILVPHDYSVQATFGLDPKDVHPDITVPGFAIPDPTQLADPNEQAYASYLRKNVPKFDPDYEFTKDLIREIRFWWLEGQGDVLLLWGPTGSGKTSSMEQWCARLGIPLFMMKGHKRFEAHEAFGTMVGGPNGTTPFQDGPMTLAAQYGLPVIINEYDRIDPSRAIVFNDVFEGRAFPVPGAIGRTVAPADGFRVVLTSNTNLVEDVSGNYGTAASQDVSVLERIYAVKCGYVSEETERRILSNVLERFTDDVLTYWFDQEGIKVKTDAGMKEGGAVSRAEFIDALIAVAHSIRKASSDGGNRTDAALERTMSTRTLRKWAVQSAANASMPEVLGLSALHQTLKRTLTDLATESTRLAIHEAVTTVFGVKENLDEQQNAQGGA